MVFFVDSLDIYVLILQIFFLWFWFFILSVFSRTKPFNHGTNFFYGSVRAILSYLFDEGSFFSLIPPVVIVSFFFVLFRTIIQRCLAIEYPPIQLRRVRQKKPGCFGGWRRKVGFVERNQRCKPKKH